jgi:hypothetical protein
MSKKKQREKLAAMERRLAAAGQQIYAARLRREVGPANTGTRSLADSYSRFRLSQLVGKAALEHLVDLARGDAIRQRPTLRDRISGSTAELCNDLNNHRQRRAI